MTLTWAAPSGDVDELASRSVELIAMDMFCYTGDSEGMR
ncbi:hypothetical protein ABIA65_006297 [Mycolicibacterium sp. 624]